MVRNRLRILEKMTIENYRAEEQIAELGLARILRECPRLRVLDIGCGSQMCLVKYLNKHGYSADGLDPELAHFGDGLMKQRITAIWPERGCIPVPDETYDLVIAHQNPILNEGLSCLRDTEYLRLAFGEDFERHMGIIDREAVSLILEAMRVVKNTGAGVIYPNIDLLKRRLNGQLELRKWIISENEVDCVPYFDQIVSYDEYLEEDCSSSLGRRTIITRTETNSVIKKALGL